MNLHAPNATNAQLCRDLLPSTIKVIDDEEMTFAYVKTPIGSNEFVQSYLEKKCTQLQREINLLSEMTHLHECFTLLRSCASAYKVTHLMRTTPPEQ